MIALSACVLLGATCRGQGSRLSDLQPEARQAVEAAAASLPCRCDERQSLSECLQSGPRCAQSERELDLLVDLARNGALGADLVQEAQGYYGSFGEAPRPFDLSRSPCKGPERAPVTVVVFSDFECPACSFARPLLDSLVAPDGKVRLCFRYFPLDSHAHSRQTAQAAEYARLHGRFWEMHDLLFEYPDTLSLDAIVALGAQVGLDAGEVRRAVESDQFLAQVNGSKAEAKGYGVSATPTLFINGRPYPLPLDGRFLARAVEDHLQYAARGGWAPSP
ncbi:MAG: thioredoxin domain-containing protein [Deltaproteobacteria bacterium]|nr:thioredoxin domain-containing protein [Deltaproteobacteria bacterium]